MKTILIGWTSLALVTAPLWAANTDAVNEVLKLQKAGLSEEVVLSFIHSKNVNYALTADDLIALQSQGLTSNELNAMLEASGNNGALLPSAPTAPAPIEPIAPINNSVLAPAAAQAPPMPQAVPATVEVAAPAPPQSPYFYQELSPYGQWIQAEDGQMYWKPAVVVANPEWRPYWDNGSWINTDAGWYWGSDYPWGSIAFHYGRWHMHPRYGWVWFPGHEWAPAWVVWRGGDTYCGWAPLPPYARFDLHTGHYFYHDRMVEANFEFGLSFGHFNFCYVRELGERNRIRFHDERQIRTIYSHTTIINNYTVIHEGGHGDRIVNRGIDPGHIASHGGRPPERVRIDDHPSAPGNRTAERIDHNSKTLTVYRPNVQEARPAINRSPSAPGNGVGGQRNPVADRAIGSPVPNGGNQPGRDSKQPAAAQPPMPNRMAPAVSQPLNQKTPAVVPPANRTTPAPVQPIAPNRMAPAVVTPNRSVPQEAAPGRPAVAPAAPQSQERTMPSQSPPRPNSFSPPARSVQPSTRMEGSSIPSRNGSTDRQKTDFGSKR